MTGYSKINKRLKKYPDGGLLSATQAGYLDDDTPQVRQAVTNSTLQNSYTPDSSGGFNASAVTGAANFGASVIDKYNTAAIPNAGGIALGGLSGAAKGAASGAAIGAAFGGVGAVPGAVIGGGIGLVSGVVGGVSKRKNGLIQQGLQRKAFARNAQDQSNQTLAQYSNNGVDATLYAEGGPVMGADTITRFMNPNIMTNLSTTNPLMVEKKNGSIGQWGNPISNDNIISKPTIPLASPTSYNPSTFQNQGQVGYNLPRNPTPNVIHSNIYAEGGNLSITPSHKGRFNAYLKRSGKTAHEALHSKDGHVRKMANYAINIGHTKKAYGGPLDSPEYEAEGGETVQGNPQLEQGTQLASDMHQIDGASHEQGGVMGQGGERIFSDRLKVSPILQEILKTNGIKVNGKSTYADVSNKLGKLKGKFEDKTDGVGKATASVMLPRIEQSLDDTFNDQEMSKRVSAYKKFSKGGRIPMYPNGGQLRPASLNADDSNSYPNYDATNPNNLTIPSEGYSYEVPTYLKTAGRFIGNAASTIGSGIGDVAGQVGDAISENSGQVANGANYLANLGSINSLNTTVNPQYLSTPNYNYVDRSGPAYNRNNALFKTGVRSLTNAGQTVNAGNIGGLYAKTLEGNSYIAGSENNRRDTYNENYNNRFDKINAENTGIYNKAQDDSRDLYNQKIGLKLGARNAFQQGIVGNIAQKQAADAENKKLLTVLATNDQNGVMTRFLQNYPKYKQLLKQYQTTSN